MTEPSRRVVVTGAAGFIGFHLAKRLIVDGASVLGVDNFNSYYDPKLKQARVAQLAANDLFKIETADISERERIGNLFEQFQPTHVVHLAAQVGVRNSLQNPRAYISSNVDGFASILEVCRQAPVRHLVYASSSSVYGGNHKVPFSESDRVDAPLSVYAATKRANELMAHAYAHLFKMPLTGLRLFTVYGPWGRPDMAYHIFTKAIFEGRPIEMFSHGNMSRDFTYVDDVVEAIVRLLDAPPINGRERSDTPHVVYNIGSNTPVELERFVEIIGAAAGRPVKKTLHPMQPGDVPRTYADVTELSNAVGFTPSTRLEEGIARFVAWYREYYGVA